MDYCSLEKAKEVVAIKYAKAMEDLHLKERGFEFPTIIWRSMGNRGGCCNYRSNVIELNTDYLKSKSWQDFLDETPLHELAHAISWQLFDARGHKKVWKNVCYQLGLAGNRCHNYAPPEGVVAKYRKKRYIARCQCGNYYVVTSIIYNRMKKLGYIYTCRKCHGTLTVSDECI